MIFIFGTKKFIFSDPFIGNKWEKNISMDLTVILFRKQTSTSIYKIMVLCYLFFCCFTENTHISLQVWDIGGQTLGGKMLENYLYGAHVSTCRGDGL